MRRCAMDTPGCCVTTDVTRTQQNSSRRGMSWPFLIAVTLLSATASQAPECEPSDRVNHAIAALGRPNAAPAEQLSILAGEPAAAVCHLIRSLHVVRDTHVVGYEQEKHADTMGVIWALRALRYLAGCREFRAPTAQNPAKWEELRREWLLRDATGAPLRAWKRTDRVPFFATWMSRDSVFIAPPDAQAEIISEWRRWYRDTGSRGFHFQTCDSVDEWYF